MGYKSNRRIVAKKIKNQKKKKNKNTLNWHKYVQVQKSLSHSIIQKTQLQNSTD